MVLFSCPVTAQLISAFVFGNAKSRFFHDQAHKRKLMSMKKNCVAGWEVKVWHVQVLYTFLSAECLFKKDLSDRPPPSRGIIWALKRICLTGLSREAYCYSQLSLVMRKLAFRICENKDADQLRGNREADQRLSFRYTDSTIPLLPKSENSSL